LSRAILVLATDEIRKRALGWIAKAPAGTRVEFKGPKRTVPQNDRLWLLLTQVSKKLLWHGQKYPEEDWKDYFMHAYKGERWMPDEDGGMVPVGRSTSDLDKKEHGELQTLIEAFCARQGIALPWDER